jgi:ribonuclease T1
LEWLTVRLCFFKLVLTGLLVLAIPAGLAIAKEAQVTLSDGQIALSQLPRQGRDTYQLILQGGPFPFEKDGVVFGNRERLLPGEKRGYYHEYTVATTGSSKRGIRRIVCGGARKSPDACYYSDDHYSSFKRIVP